jgi:hypothetical protein
MRWQKGGINQKEAVQFNHPQRMWLQRMPLFFPQSRHPKLELRLNSPTKKDAHAFVKPLAGYHLSSSSFNREYYIFFRQKTIIWKI